MLCDGELSDGVLEAVSHIELVGSELRNELCEF
jgi:hypothetical protein